MHIGVNIICPICKVKKVINIPKSIVNQAKQLSTISIPKGTVCKHHFQIFIDKNFSIRGYQKVDFELGKQKDSEIRNLLSPYSLKEEMTIGEIYNEFWEFIDDNNEIFRKFILADKKRRNSISNTIVKTPNNSDLLENI
ncbi:MAG: hypothetical protein ACFFD5_02565 [Candidatus Thorarchaeota archaeon]